MLLAIDRDELRQVRARPRGNNRSYRFFATRARVSTQLPEGFGSVAGFGSGTVGIGLVVAGPLVDVPGAWIAVVGAALVVVGVVLANWPNHHKPTPTSPAKAAIMIQPTSKPDMPRRVSAGAALGDLAEAGDSGPDEEGLDDITWGVRTQSTHSLNNNIKLPINRRFMTILHILHRWLNGRYRDQLLATALRATSGDAVFSPILARWDQIEILVRPPSSVRNPVGVARLELAARNARDRPA